MDKKKQTKEEKVGADGLTKKERRALKVQARQTDDNKAEQKSIRQNSVSKNIQNIESNQDISANESTNINKNVVFVEELDTSVDKPELELSMKEKRKLEWEKKIASVKNEHNIEMKQLSKSEQRAKRRETQEAQRLAKTNSNEQNRKITEVEKVNKSTEIKVNESKVVPSKSTLVGKRPCSKKFCGSKFLALCHLPFRDDESVGLSKLICPPDIHPAFIQLGVQHSSNTILGSNARCLSLLSALVRLIKDVNTPPEQEFSRYFESVLQKSTTHLQNYRPMSVSMTNVLKKFRLQLIQIDTNIPDENKKKKLLDFIGTCIREDILTAGQAISLKVMEKISNGDTILIYGCSSLITRILIDAFVSQKQFKVIVVDNRPLSEGKELIRRLTAAGITCTCISINGLYGRMASVTKVLLGAESLLSNGFVMGRAGTSLIALAAKAFNKPVLVCCETYKFSERVQVDSFYKNENANPARLLNDRYLDDCSPVNSCRKRSKVGILNLFYDVTPASLITGVVTELAIVPCTSAPAILRVKPIEI